jgi:hypothetical protein
MREVAEMRVLAGTLEEIRAYRACERAGREVVP